MLNYYEIGQRIRKYRKSRQLSQEELAARADISATHMSHIETGNTKLSLPVLAALAVELEVSADELLFGQSSGARGEAVQELSELLETCSPIELKLIREIARTVKSAMDQHLGG